MCNDRPQIATHFRIGCHTTESIRIEYELKDILRTQVCRERCKAALGLPQDLNDFGFCGILARAGMRNVRLSKYYALRHE